MQITINDNADFLITDERGDVNPGMEQGYYHEDTRFLSTWQWRINGNSPLVLASRATSHANGVYFLANTHMSDLPRGMLEIVRRQTLGAGLHESLAIVNHGEQPVTFTLELRYAADFGHIFEIKSTVDGFPPEHPRQSVITHSLIPNLRRMNLHGVFDGHMRNLTMLLSAAPTTATEATLGYTVTLGPQSGWRLGLGLFATTERETPPELTADWEDAMLTRQERGAEAQARFLAAAPHLTTDSLVLEQAYAQSALDYAALRMDNERAGPGEYYLAAGIPWFMTLFGRDSLIASYQALPFFPDLAKGVLRALARLQGAQVDTLRIEEPGKILHEMRNDAFNGAHDSASMFPYYGTIDATPLFIMLLAAVYRVTKDAIFVRALRSNMVRALEWMDRYGDRDGDGYIEYIREAERGLANQGWKDSGDSIRYRDGRLAPAPIALCEAQGYAYAARIGAAEIFEALGEFSLAATQRERVADLKARFNRDFWMPDREFYALGLDGAKRQIDALTSNPGQLLWTGIVDADHADALVRQLMAPDLFADWGVRTMAQGEGAYNPIAYHNGSVWPHDNSLIVAGLARYGYADAAARITSGLLAALSYYPDHRLPELFAGYSQEESGFPVEYPTACKPQAWASGTVFLLVSAALGFDASVPDLRGTPFLPKQVNRLQLSGMWLHGQRRRLLAERTPDGSVYAHIAEPVLTPTERADDAR